MAILFQTRFDNTFDVDFPAGAPYPPPNIFGNYNRVLGRGIDGGYSFTCGGGTLLQQIAALQGPDYINTTTRIQWGCFGNLLDSASGISTEPGLSILRWWDPVTLNTMGSGNFSAVLTARENGAISLHAQTGGLTPGYFHATSAPGILIYDGRMNGIQVTFSFPNHISAIYNVVVNNVSVLSGTITANYNLEGGACVGMKSWGMMLSSSPIVCIEHATIPVISVYGSGHPVGGTYYWQTSIPEVIIEDTVNIIDYPPCNAPNAVMNACTAIVGGKLTVTKVAIPDSGSHIFAFTSTGGLSPSVFTLINGQSRVFSGLATGTYGVFEVEDPHWIPTYSVVGGGIDNTNILVTPSTNAILTVTNTGEFSAPSGLYFINPDKTTKHDSYYGSIEKKIPNPTIKTGLLGE